MEYKLKEKAPGSENKTEKSFLLKKSKFFIKNVVILSLLSSAILFLSIILILVVVHVIDIRDSVIKIIFGVLGGMLIPYEKTAITNILDSAPWELYLSFLFRKGFVNKKDLIRISYAGHLVVEVDGEYLLLKNKNGIGLFHFPSMTYPLSLEDFNSLHMKYDIVRDDYIPNMNDYRLLVPAKKLKAFYKEFCHRIDPTNCGIYDLIVDDMVERCGLDKKSFENKKSIFKKRVFNNIEYSRYTNHYEMIVQDLGVFFPNEEQRAALRKLKETQRDGYKFATIDLIKSNGTDKANGKLHADIAPFVYDCLTSSDKEITIESNQ